MNVFADSSSTRFVAVLLCILLLPLLPFAFTNEQYVFLIALVAIWSIFAIGFDLAFAVAGLLSFGHAVFFGVGGYALALLTIDATLPYPVALILAGAAGGIVALLFATIASRSSGIFFALVTLILAQLAYVLMSSKLKDWTGGIDGLPGVPRPTLPFLDMTNTWNYASFVIVIAIATILIMALLRVSPYGDLIQAIRQNEVRARQLGYRTTWYSITAFGISGVYSGIAGALNASLLAFISPDTMHWSVSAEVIMMTVIGGMGTLLGPIIGVLAVEILKELLSSLSFLWHGLLGLLFIIFSVFLPGGILGLIKRLRAYRFTHK